MTPNPLLDTMRAMTAVADHRHPMPILNHVLIESNGHLRLTATDLEIGIRTTLPPLPHETDFEVTVPAKLFRDVLAVATGDVGLGYELPEDGRSDEQRAYRERYGYRDIYPRFIIHDSTAEWRLNGMYASDFPTWPDMFSWSLDEISTAEAVKKLKAAIKANKPASRWQRESTTIDVQPIGELPLATVERLAAVLSRLKKTHPTIEVSVEEKYVCLDMGDTEIIVRRS